MRFPFRSAEATIVDSTDEAMDGLEKSDSRGFGAAGDQLGNR
jgi:hypothetical protein